jgi:hypothetical protein
VPITNDAAAEPEERFDLVLSAPVGATLPDPRGTALIGASDQPTVTTPVISVDNITVGENDRFAEFVVRLNAPSTNLVSVNFSTGNGTALNGSDFTADSGTLTFAAGETVKTVRVPIINDTTVESKEDFFFNLSSATNAVIGNDSALATIIDNDATSGTPLQRLLAIAANDPRVPCFSGADSRPPRSRATAAQLASLCRSPDGARARGRGQVRPVRPRRPTPGLTNLRHFRLKPKKWKPQTP